MTRSDRSPWLLDPAVVFLNHGSYGACPRPVLDEQLAWRERMEREPLRFLAHDLEGLLDEARRELAGLLGAHPDGIAFVPNATTGVNAVLGALRFQPGDELLATNHEYNACLNTLRRAADRDGATVVVAPVPFPVSEPAEVVDAVLGAVTPRTRFALLSHVTGPTALVLPIEELVAELSARGIAVLVDGAHALGMVPLSIDSLAAAGASWYTGNGHKWLCGPKGSGFLWARDDVRARTRPVVTSHGLNDPRTDRPRFLLEFDWVGTSDPSPYLALPAAIRFMASRLPGGWAEVMAANHALVLRARDLVCEVLRIRPPAPDRMIGSMAAVPLPVAVGTGRAFEQRLFDEHRIEVPVTSWPVPAARIDGRPAEAELLRVSAQLYNSEADYRSLHHALSGIVERPVPGDWNPWRAGWDSNPRPED